MSTASNSNAGSDADADSDADAGSDADSPSIADRLQTLGRVIWATFLASVVVFALIPAVALWFGAVPFDPPTATPYFALVGFALVGTAALVVGAIYDV